MDGFATQFNTLVVHLYYINGVDCTYTRVKTGASWTVRLIPHIDNQYFVVNRQIAAAPLHVYFRALVSTDSTDTRIAGKTASDSFITPMLNDTITFNSEVYKIVPCDMMDRGWTYMNDRRSQIEISTMKATQVESH